MFPRCRIQVSAGFVLLAAWFGLVNGWRLLAAVLAAASVHELGHWAVLRALGGRADGLRIGVLGAVLETDSQRLSYAGELAVVLAGPAANLLAAAALAALEARPAAIGANVVLCAFNLLPVRPLDGGRALYLLASWLAGPAVGERAACWAGSAAAGVLAAGTAFVMWRSGGSLWLLPALCASVQWCVGPWFSALRRACLIK